LLFACENVLRRFEVEKTNKIAEFSFSKDIHLPNCAVISLGKGVDRILHCKSCEVPLDRKYVQFVFSEHVNNWKTFRALHFVACSKCFYMKEMVELLCTWNTF